MIQGFKKHLLFSVMVLVVIIKPDLIMSFSEGVQAAGAALHDFGLCPWD